MAIIRSLTQRIRGLEVLLGSLRIKCWTGMGNFRRKTKCRMKTSLRDFAVLMAKLRRSTNAKSSFARDFTVLKGHSSSISNSSIQTFTSKCTMTQWSTRQGIGTIHSSDFYFLALSLNYSLLALSNVEEESYLIVRGQIKKRVMEDWGHLQYVLFYVIFCQPLSKLKGR